MKWNGKDHSNGTKWNLFDCFYNLWINDNDSGRGSGSDSDIWYFKIQLIQKTKNIFLKPFDREYFTWMVPDSQYGHSMEKKFREQKERRVQKGLKFKK